ncbi:MAG TPA: PAS domain S-box protein [Spirochaetia bacterium]|nr:PAS domain S-box protein [Spirochaetia bacterium]HRZ63974.1 PAS domain S-box protein [Spirochaetia bacterium]
MARAPGPSIGKLGPSGAERPGRGKEHPRPSLRFRLLPALALACLLGLAWPLSLWYRDRLVERSRDSAGRLLSALAKGLAVAAERRLALLESFHAYAALRGGGEGFEDEYSELAGALVGLAPGIRALQYYPREGTVLVYPAAGNEQTLGRRLEDLVDDERPAVRADVARALASRRLALSEPYLLRQGGLGLVARKGLFRDGRLAGMVVLVLDLPPLLAEGGLGEPPREGGLLLGLRSDSSGVFAGEAEAFELEPELETVPLAEGSWTLAGVPAGGWEASLRLPLLAFRAAEAAFCLLVGFVLRLLTSRDAYLRGRIEERGAALEAEYRSRLEAERELHARDASLAESEARYRALFEDSHAAMILVDPEDGAIVGANQAAVEFYGWGREELLAKNLRDLGDSGGEELRRKLGRAAAQRRNRFESRQRRSDGGLRDVEVFAGPISLGGRTHILAVLHDVTARAAAERERDEIAARMAHYLATSPTVTYSIRLEAGEARWLWASENIGELLGYSPEEALAHDWWISGVHPLDRARAMGAIATLASRGLVSQEYRFLRKDRRAVWLRDEMRFASGGSGAVEIVGTLTDVSARKEVEEELSLKSKALDAAANAVVIADREGTISWVNPAFEALTGFSRQEALGKKAGELVRSEEQGPGFYRALWEDITSGRVWHGLIRNRRKDGSPYVEELTITPVLDETRCVSGFVAIEDDVTERELSRERLESSLAENRVLLREIHHRVNNSLQLIASMLNLTQERLGDARLSAAVGDVSRRLASMALVHGQFYGSEDLASIDFGLFLRQSADWLRSEYPAFGDKLSVATGGEEVRLDLAQAIPAALACTELIVNAVRHAYPPGLEAGPIVVAVARRGCEVELSVRDEGAGLPEGFDPAGASSLGIILVRGLAAQLGGSIEFRSGGGTLALLRFPEIGRAEARP